MGWLPSGKFPIDWRELINITDNEVLAAMSACSLDANHPLKELADRVIKRKHFRTVNQLVMSNKKRRPTIFQDTVDYAKETFGNDNVLVSTYGPKSEVNDFLVVNEDGTVESSLVASGVIAHVPSIEIGYVFVRPDLKISAKVKIEERLTLLLAEADNGL